MSHDVRLSPYARLDLSRLVEFLVERDLSAARRTRAALVKSFETLATLPERGTAQDGPSANYRQLHVKFGRFGYVIQYRVDPDRVVVARIFHALEDRRR